MPQFSIHTPKTQSDMRHIRKVEKLRQQHLPIGVIGQQGEFSWGYNGTSYYVSEGVWDYLVTRVHMTLDEAKQLFNALVWIEAKDTLLKIISNLIRSIRKLNISGDELMWKFIDLLGEK